MEKRDTLTRALAVIGTVLAWLPLLAPLFLGLASLIVDGIFRLDYLMPAELFLVAAAGGGLLLWAALRARWHPWRVGGSLGVAVLALAGSQGLAVVTGLAHGDTAVGGWEWALVLAVLGVYIAAVLALGVSGIGLWRTLSRLRTAGG